MSGPAVLETGLDKRQRVAWSTTSACENSLSLSLSRIFSWGLAYVEVILAGPAFAHAEKHGPTGTDWYGTRRKRTEKRAIEAEMTTVGRHLGQVHCRKKLRHLLRLRQVYPQRCAEREGGDTDGMIAMVGVHRINMGRSPFAGSLNHES